MVVMCRPSQNHTEGFHKDAKQVCLFKEDIVRPVLLDAALDLNIIIVTKRNSTERQMKA